MSAIVCLPVDFSENSVGLPPLLEERIDSRSVLYHTASRLSLSGDLRVVLLLPDGRGCDGAAERARELTSGLDCEVFTSSAGDVPGRELLRRGRLWALSSWRGGIGHTTYYDEAGRPAALAEAAERFDADAVGLVTPDSPYADPELASRILAWHRDRIKKARVTVAGVPPGLAPAFFNAEVLKAYADSNLTLASSIAYQRSRPRRDLSTTEAHYEADIRLRTAPWRLTAHSRRQLDLLRGLAECGAAPTRATALDVVETLRGNHGLWSGPVPQKIEIEPTTRTDGAPFYLRDLVESRPEADLPLQDFRRMLDSLAPHRDVLLTLGGLGEPMLHARLPEMVAAAKEAGVLGVHVATCGRLLDERTFLELREAGLDVLSVDIAAHTEETYERLFGREGLARAAAATEKAFELRRSSGWSAPLVVAEITKSRQVEPEIEGFFDHWQGRCDWPLIRPYNDFAGEIEDAATVHMRTSSRGPCRKIFTELFVDAEGRAWPCRQDVKCTRPLGDAAEAGIPTLWHSDFLEGLREAEARRAQMGGGHEVFELCRNCRDWYYSS